jgi:hypothetical protein
MKQGQGYVLHYRHNGEEGFHDLSAEEAKPLRDRVPDSLVPLKLPASDGNLALNEEALVFAELCYLCCCFYVLELWFICVGLVICG